MLKSEKMSLICEIKNLHNLPAIQLVPISGPSVQVISLPASSALVHLPVKVPFTFPHALQISSWASTIF